MSYNSNSYNLVILCLIIFFISCNITSASIDNFPTGARYTAIGNIGVMCSDLWSVSQNQAGLGFYNHLVAGFYHENRFALSQLSLHSIAFTVPTGTGTFGLSCTYFGYSLYNESKIGLAFGKSLSDKCNKPAKRIL